MLPGGGGTWSYGYVMDTCSSTQSNQRFMWIRDDAFWDNGALMDAPVGSPSGHKLPVGPFLARPEVTTNSSFFCLSVSVQTFSGVQKLMSFQSTNGTEPLYTLQESQCLAWADVASVPTGAPANAVAAFARNSPSLTKGSYPYAYDAQAGQLRPVNALGDPIMDECFGYDRVNNELMELKGDACNNVLARWDVPCGLPGSFAHPACDAFYRVHSSAYRRYIPKDHTFWVPCSGQITKPQLSGSCVFCAEPWNLTQGAYAGTSSPMIVWPPDQTAFLKTFANYSAMNVSSHFATDRLMDAWYPPESGGGMPGFHGFWNPTGHDAVGRCTYDGMPPNRTHIPSCGAIPQSIGVGEWWHLPGRPQRHSGGGFGPCPSAADVGGDTNELARRQSTLLDATKGDTPTASRRHLMAPPYPPPHPPSPYPPPAFPPVPPGGYGPLSCPMEMVPAEGTAMGFTCPTYACDMQPRALPHLASGHGLSAFITVPPPRQWWLDALNATDPVAAELLVGENTAAHTVLNFNSNAAWYPLFVEFSRTLSYDVIWEFQARS